MAELSKQALLTWLRESIRCRLPTAERVESYSRGRSVTLLGALLTLITLGPWLNEWLVGFAIWEVLITWVALSAIHRLSVNRGQARFAALLSLPAMACLWLRQFVPVVWLSQAGLGLLTLFLLYNAATVLLHVFSQEKVSMDTLVGAFCVYLLVGVASGSFYSLLYLQNPGAFHLPGGWSPLQRSGIVMDVPFNLMVYYSFTTLTTVAYGDVLPLTDASRAVSVLEAVLGHFYLAVLVARLVGLHIADTRREDRSVRVEESVGRSGDEARTLGD